MVFCIQQKKRAFYLILWINFSRFEQKIFKDCFICLSPPWSTNPICNYAPNSFTVLPTLRTELITPESSINYTSCHYYHHPIPSLLQIEVTMDEAGSQPPSESTKRTGLSTSLQGSRMSLDMHNSDTYHYDFLTFVMFIPSKLKLCLT